MVGAGVLVGSDCGGVVESVDDEPSYSTWASVDDSVDSVSVDGSDGRAYNEGSGY